MKLKVISFIALIGIVIASCNTNSQKHAKTAKTDSAIAKLAAIDTLAMKDGQLRIFYNMYLPILNSHI